MNIVNKPGTSQRIVIGQGELDYIGEGNSFIAFADEAKLQVSKLSKDSFGQDEALEFADMLKGEYDFLVKHLGSVVTATSVGVLEVPEEGWRVIQYQPYIKGVSVASYLEGGYDKSVVTQIRDFYIASLAMRASTGHMPDLWGRAKRLPNPLASPNLLVVNSEDGSAGLQLIDAVYSRAQRNPRKQDIFNYLQCMRLRASCVYLNYVCWR